MVSLAGIASSILDEQVHVHENNKLCIPFPLLEQPCSNEVLVSEAYKRGRNQLISALLQLFESTPSQFWSTLEYSDASINMISAILESFPRESDGVDNICNTWQLKAIYKLTLSIILRLCSSKYMMQNGEINQNLEEISSELRTDIANRLLDMNNLFAFIVVYWKENSLVVLEVINFMSYKLDQYYDAIIESIPKIYETMMRNIARLNKSLLFKVTASANNDKRIVSDYSNMVHFVCNIYEEFSIYIKAMPQLALMIVRDKGLLRRLLKLSYKITDLVFNHLSQDTLVRRFGFHRRLLSRCLLIDWQAAKFLRLLLKYTVFNIPPTFEHAGEQAAYDQYICSEHSLTLDRNIIQYLDLMEHLLKHCPKIVMYYKREYSFDEDLQSFGGDRDGPTNQRCRTLHADFQKVIDDHARATMKLFRKKRLLQAYDGDTWPNEHKMLADELIELLADQLFGSNFIRFFTYMMAPTTLADYDGPRDDERIHMKQLEILTTSFIEWRAPTGRQTIPINILMLFTATDDIFVPHIQNDVNNVNQDKSAPTDIATNEKQEPKELISIIHGKKHGTKLKPINEEICSTQELRSFYKQFEEIERYKPIEKEIDYSLLYDDECDDTYDDVEAGKFDDLDQDSKMFVVHRLNEPLPEEDDKEEDETEQPTSITSLHASAKASGPVQSSPMQIKNPSAYTGGRQRQLKERRSKYNQRNRAEQKRIQTFGK